MLKAHPMLNSLSTLLGLAALVFIALCALLYFRQDSFIFFPRPNDPLLAMKHRQHRIEIRTSGAKLEGWQVDNPRASTPFTILYFGGNAEDVLYTATTAPLLDARRVIVVNYRGYGGSTGSPGQAALYEDAAAVYQHALGAGAAAEDIVVMGRSLGAAVATKLASERPVAGALLITPFDSLAAVASHHYRFMPVRWLLRHPFPSTRWAKQTRAPALMIAAADDDIVPPRHAQQLQRAWAGPSEIHVLEGVGHNNLELHESYYTLINAFLARLAQTPATHAQGADPATR